jgi:hypothetical protein
VSDGTRYARVAVLLGAAVAAVGATPRPAHAGTNCSFRFDSFATTPDVCAGGYFACVTVSCEGQEDETTCECTGLTKNENPDRNTNQIRVATVARRRQEAFRSAV